MLYLIFVILSCIAGVVIVNNCRERKNQKLREMQNEKTRILQIPPAHSKGTSTIENGKDRKIHTQQNYPDDTLQKQVRENDEMYWLMIQNYRF